MSDEEDIPEEDDWQDSDQDWSEFDEEDSGGDEGEW